MAAPSDEGGFDGVEAGLLSSGAFLRRLLESSGDCIKVLDLDGRLVFMSAGGLRVMEIDDFSPFVGCPWLEFWKGEKEDDARAAVALAKAGGLGRFQGWCATAKGTLKWWDVQVTAITGADGRPQQLLSISRDITELKHAEEQQRLLAAEMHHRVKNLLSVVQAIASQTFRDGTASLEASRKSFDARLRALSEAHNVLTSDADDAARLRDIAAGVLAPHGLADAQRFVLDGPDVLLTGRHALALTLVLHELATNAVKYGALSAPAGRVEARWEIAPQATPTAPPAMVLSWIERGGPAPAAAPARKGFGSRLIERSIADIDGRIEVSYEATGLRCRMEIPLQGSASDHDAARDATQV